MELSNFYSFVKKRYEANYFQNFITIKQVLWDYFDFEVILVTKKFFSISWHGMTP